MKKSKKLIKKTSKKKSKIFGGSNNWSSSSNNENNSKKTHQNLVLPSKPKFSASFKGKNDIQFLEIGEIYLCNIKKKVDKSINFICNLKITEKKFMHDESTDDKIMIVKGELKLNLKESSKKLDGKTKNLVSKLYMINQLNNFCINFIGNISHT